MSQHQLASTPRVTAAPVTPTHRGTQPHRLQGGARQTPWRTASVLGLVAFTLSMLGSWIPSLWGDEAASIMSAERSWASLFRALGNVDSVHGTYYVFLHLWIDVFGASAFSVRLPSAIAVGVAAAGIVILAKRLGNYRTAVIAGIVFAVLPRTTYMGAEARSYSIGTALAVWLTILFVELLSRRVLSRRVLSRRLWLVYSLLFAACIYVFLYLVLLAVVFGIVLLTRTRSRQIILRWLGFTALGVVLATPVIFFAVAERNQISFLAHRHGVTLNSFLVSQWFGSDALALVAWLSIAALAAASVVVWVRRRRRTAAERHLQTSAAAVGTAPSLLVLAFVWFLVPPLILFLATTFVAPLYSVRYMSFVTPAAAVLLAIAIDRIAIKRWIAIVAVAALVALAAPSYVQQRGPYAKDGGVDWAEVASVIGHNSQAGDAIVFDESIRPSLRPRLAMHVYPSDFTKVVDVRLKTPYQAASGLWDTTQSIPASASRIAQTDGRLWLVEYRGPSGSGGVSSVGQTNRLAQLRTLGYTISKTYTLHRDAVYLLTKGT